MKKLAVNKLHNWITLCFTERHSKSAHKTACFSTLNPHHHILNYACWSYTDNRQPCDLVLSTVNASGKEVVCNDNTLLCSSVLYCNSASLVSPPKRYCAEAISHASVIFVTCVGDPLPGTPASQTRLSWASPLPSEPGMIIYKEEKGLAVTQFWITEGGQHMFNYRPWKFMAVQVSSNMCRPPLLRVSAWGCLKIKPASPSCLRVFHALQFTLNCNNFDQMNTFYHDIYVSTSDLTWDSTRACALICLRIQNRSFKGTFWLDISRRNPLRGKIRRDDCIGKKGGFCCIAHNFADLWTQEIDFWWNISFSNSAVSLWMCLHPQQTSKHRRSNVISLL